MNDAKKNFLILVINPGSTSTKFALFKDSAPVLKEEIRHDPEQFKDCPTIADQREVRLHLLIDFLEKANIEAGQLDAVVGRGGIIHPVASGTYRVNQIMYNELKLGYNGSHASNLGGIIAYDIGNLYGIPAFIVDPVVVDEMLPTAKFSGIPEIERLSMFHVLNTKAVLRKCSELDFNVKYEDACFVIAHLGGGISVAAHQYGRVIDVNDALNGDGPFTPERSGALPVRAVVNMCFSRKFSRQKMDLLIAGDGGLLAYLGTNDLKRIEKQIHDGDDYARSVVEAMAWQICKEIGAMFAIIDGNVTAIVLTGGLAYSEYFVSLIQHRVVKLAPVRVYPGEYEMEALALGGLRVLTGVEPAKEYMTESLQEEKNV